MIIVILVLAFVYAGYDAYTIYAYKKAADNANFLSDRIAARTVQRNLIMEAADIRAELCLELKLKPQILETHFTWYEEGKENKSSQAKEEYDRWKFQQALRRHAHSIAVQEQRFRHNNVSIERLYRRNERLLEKLR